MGMPGFIDRIPNRYKRAILDRLPGPVWRQLSPLVHGETSLHHALKRVRLRRLEAVARSFGDLPVVAVEHQRAGMVARCVGEFHSEDVLDANLALVCHALTTTDVEWFVLDQPTGRRRTVVCPRNAQAEVLRALARSLAQRPVYVAPVRDGDAGRAHSAADVADKCAGHSVVRVFELVTTRDARAVLGDERLGCDLEFWRVSRADHVDAQGNFVPEGAWSAPVVNRWTDRLSPQERHTTSVPRTQGTVPTLNLLRAPHIFSMTEPVDAVYTWVDGDDPEWLERKAATHAAVGLGDLHVTAANSSRFQSHDELRYSMRSLDMYADWIRHVYLVTDDQVPAWLDTSHPRLSVVSHRTLFGDRGRLPTFNSHAIESQLHHLRGLSEHFLYLNDDVFFGRPVTPEHFFTANGLTLFFVSKAKLGLGPPSVLDPPVMSAAKNNREIIEKSFGTLVTNKFKHVPHALRRSVLAEMESEFPEDFARTSRSQFRHPTDISVAAALHHYYAYATGRAVTGSLRYFYADIAREDTPDRLARLLRLRDYDVFCLNDHDSSRVDPEQQAAMIERFLKAYFPLPSSFEKS